MEIHNRKLLEITRKLLTLFVILFSKQVDRPALQNKRLKDGGS
jgi:hypothetical protein